MIVSLSDLKKTLFKGDDNEEICSNKTILVFGYSGFSKDDDHIITTVNEAGKAIAFVKKRAPKRDSFFVDTLRLKRVVDMCYSQGTRVISFSIIC